jgi:hypothetical protein
VPIHYDDYRAFTSPLFDYVRRTHNRGLKGITPVHRGDTVTLPLRTSKT